MGQPTWHRVVDLRGHQLLTKSSHWRARVQPEPVGSWTWSSIAGRLVVPHGQIRRCDPGRRSITVSPTAHEHVRRTAGTRGSEMLSSFGNGCLESRPGQVRLDCARPGRRSGYVLEANEDKVGSVFVLARPRHHDRSGDSQLVGVACGQYHQVCSTATSTLHAE